MDPNVVGRAISYGQVFGFCLMMIGIILYKRRVERVCDIVVTCGATIALTCTVYVTALMFYNDGIIKQTVKCQCGENCIERQLRNGGS